MSRWALLAAFAIGCGPPAAPASPASPVAGPDAAVGPPLPLDEDLPRLALRAVALYREWRAAFTEAGTDCALAAARMNALADANADVIEANARVYRAGRDRVAALRRELEKHEADLDAAAKAIVESPTMSACASDAAFSDALDRLGGE